MTVLKVGQRLWWVDRNNQTEGYVIVAEIASDKIRVWYNGKIKDRPHSAIGRTLFLTPQLRKEENRKAKQKNCGVSKTAVKLEYVLDYRKKHVNEKKNVTVIKEEKTEKRFFEPIARQEKCCDICALRKNGSCTSLRNELCEDYRTLQSVSAEERSTYPQYGDAMAYRKRDRKHFK